MLAKTPFFRVVSQLLVFALLFGLIPAPTAEASISAPERPLSFAALPLAESVPPALLAVVVAVAGDEEAKPCAVVFAVVDPHTPSKYHRARWMDPRVGRFAAMDPYEGLLLDPTTLHRFSYVGADPLNKVDPTGKIASNFLFGNLVHDKISEDFEQTGVGRITNRGGSFFYGRLPFGIGRFRPDLVDTQYKQLFEIKTVREYAEGQAKLALYLNIFNWADPDKTHPWTRGTAAVYSPTRSLIPLDTFGTYALVSPTVLGVITYDVTNLPATIATLATLAIKISGAVGTHLTVQAGFATQFAVSGVF